MMFKVAKLGIAIAAVLALIVPAAYAGVPDVNNSYFVPQAGTVGTAALEGLSAYANFRMCPNNDGGASLFNNARIKIYVRDVNNNPIAGIAAADICMLFNGGTTAQGFSGIGADSIIANSTWNQNPLCPDVRCVSADAPTDASGVAYITFAGADVNNPGVTLRNANRKWGHIDFELPVYVLGFKISGRPTTASPASPAYILRIKNMDYTNTFGLGAVLNVGEQVTSSDFNGVANGIGLSSTTSYWKDFNSSGGVTSADFNIIVNHNNHTCTFPLNP